MSKLNLETQRSLENGDAPLHFVRRVFFDRNTLEVLCCYHMAGAFMDNTVDDDWEQIPELIENVQRKDDVDVLQWYAPDLAVEAMCAQAAWVKVRHSATDPSGYEIYDATNELPEYIDSESEASKILSYLEGGEEVPSSLPESQRQELSAVREAMNAMRSVLTKQQLENVDRLLDAKRIESAENLQMPSRLDDVIDPQAQQTGA